MLKNNALVFGILFLFFFSGYSILNHSQASQLEIIIGPYTQNITQTSITIIWETNMPSINNSIHYGETDAYGYIIRGESGVSHHEITVNPEFTRGHYKVVSDTEERGSYKFKLIPLELEGFNFVVYGDTRSNQQKRRMVTTQINNESLALVLHSGDMVAKGNQWDEWQEWLDDSMTLLQNTTMFGARGNHEENGEYYRRVFTPPTDTDCWYSFDYGNCHFIIIDNNVNYGKGSRQYRWLERDLASTDKPLKVIVQHEGMYCAGGHDSNLILRNALEPLINDFGVQVVFSGHNHFYQRTEEINGTVYVTTAGGGAPLYAPKNAWFVNTSKKAYHYCLINVSTVTGTLMISARYGINGSIFDRYFVNPKLFATIKKPEKALYIFNKKIISLPSAVIIGKIDIEVVTSDYQSGIEKVEFYIDNEYKETVVISPYNWTWDERAFLEHTIKVVAYNNTGDIVDREIQVWKFL